jgi:peptidoglycan/LPS O-acetylase OafA/YrhL
LNRTSKYLTEIDGLRAIAVIAVIANHLNASWLPSGHLGVDIFFVISGYVITMSLLTSRPETNSIWHGIIGFYARRVKRLAPALLCFVAITGVVSCLFTPEPSHGVYTGIAAIFALSNFYLLSTATDYFGQSADLNFFTHTWTLAVEEQFYLFYPLLLLTIVKLFGANRGKIFLTYFLGVTILLSGAAYISMLERNPLASFYMMPLRFWELGIGCLTALLFENVDLVSTRVKGFHTSFALVPLIASLFTPLSYHGISIFFVVGLSTLLILLIRAAEKPSQILSNPALLRIGLISYSLYLWHWGVIVLARWTIGDTWWAMAMQVILMFAFASLSYKYVEIPLRYNKWRLEDGSVLILGFLISCAVAASLYVISSGEPSKLYLGYSGKGLNSLKESQIFQPRENYSEFLSKVREKRRACNMTPHHLSKDNAPPNVDKQFLANCLASDKKKVILVGDSFANAISDHVALAASNLGYEFRMIFGYGCPYPMRLDNIKTANQHDCYVNAEFLLSNLEDNLNEGDILIHRLYYQKNQYVTPDSRAVETSFSAYADETSNLLQLVRRKHASLVIVGTNWEINQCEHNEWFNRLQCPWDINMNDMTRNRMAIGMNAYFREMAIDQDESDFFVIDPIEEICTSDPVTCPVERRDLRLMRDRYHLSHAAVDKLYESIATAISSVHSQKEL